MKAEEVLKQEMGESFMNLSPRSKIDILQAMKEYARIQIEKDREQCISEADKSKGPGNIRHFRLT